MIRLVPQAKERRMPQAEIAMKRVEDLPTLSPAKNEQLGASWKSKDAQPTNSWAKVPWRQGKDTGTPPPSWRQPAKCQWTTE